MSRRLRYVPEGGALVEVTSRTVHGRYLLRPGRAFNEIFVGVLARAKRLYPVELCAVACLSGHYHLLMQVEDAEALAQFMRYFNGNLAQEAGRLHDWREKIWGRRYQGIVVSDEEAAHFIRQVIGQDEDDVGALDRPRRSSSHLERKRDSKGTLARSPSVESQAHGGAVAVFLWGWTSRALPTGNDSSPRSGTSRSCCRAPFSSAARRPRSMPAIAPASTATTYWKT